MKHIFISFSSSEYEQASKVVDNLEKHNFPCFIANRDLVAGKEYAEQLISNIESAGVVLLMLSKASNNSPHVLREIEFAVSHKIPIIVYKIEEVELSKSMEYFLMTHQWIPDSDDTEKLLLDAVTQILGASRNDDNKKRRGVEASHKKKLNPAMIAIIGLSILVVVLLCVLIFTRGKASSSKADSDDNADESNELVQKYNVGDTLTFGSYYDEPIEWRVLRINPDETLVLVSKYILTMKSYDAPEGGKYNYYDGVDYWSYENHIVEDESLVIKIRGNNDWNTSNLRTWLNSDGEVVYYQDQAPTYQAVGENYYEAESGFLYGFSDEEKAAIVTVRNQSPANSFSNNAKSGIVTTEDRVYILSSDELQWFDDAGMSRYAKPSEACKAHDQYIESYESFTEYAHTDNYYYWLRDNGGDEINHEYIALTEFEEDDLYLPANCGSSDYGVRPVITVNPVLLP